MRQHFGDVVHRRLLAVYHAEPVGHESAVITDQSGQLPGQRHPLTIVLAGFPRVEPDVLQKQNVAVGETLRSS